jgi:hypothetical protein
MFTRQNQENRVICCKKYRKFYWNKLVFSDESYFQMFKHIIKQWGKKRGAVKTPQKEPAIMV